jgi:hypothetical protein
MRGGALVAALALAGCGGKPGPEAYARIESFLTERGGLRYETAPSDAPFGNADLALNFERIALRYEADVNLPGGDDNAAETRLRRWEVPIRWRVAGEGAGRADRAEVAGLFERIAAATGHDIAEAASDGSVNFLVLITEPREREAASAMLGALSPALAETFDLWRTSENVICAGVLASTVPGSAEISVAFVFIGAEVGGALRRACIEEEIAQAMGLPNDHPAARPSIFNDDQEFAVLTEHDAWLLRILYDPRLRPGMTAEEARAAVRAILADIRPEVDA